MRCIAVMLLAALILAPVYAGASSELTVDVSYLGQGLFKYKKTAYTYGVLVAQLQSDYAGQHIDWIVVDMGAVAAQQDKTTVCQLRQALLTRVKIVLTGNGERHPLFCN